MNDFTPIFKNLYIVELATALAGPQTGTFFMELGAQVTKMEPPMGDVSRHWKNTFESDSDRSSIYYLSINGNKKSMTIDLNDSRDKIKLKNHLRKADIVITNFTALKAQEFSLTYQDLKELKSDVILANISGYGLHDESPAFDILIQAESGLLSMTGYPNDLPAKIPIPIVDILASHQLKEGILCGLLKRQNTGEGAEIQVSLIDSAISALANQAGNYLMGGIIPAPMGTQHPSIAPYGDLFYTSDGKCILLAVGSEKQFKSLCIALDQASLSDHKKFSTNKTRVKNRKALHEKISHIIAMKKGKYWQQKFKLNKVPATMIKSLAEVFSQKRYAHMVLKGQTQAESEFQRVRTVVF
jgi:crotonobetainyl-CoA:carnitine CoA-transferase CaiB-like acyl-CoA transferase